LQNLTDLTSFRVSLGERNLQIVSNSGTEDSNLSGRKLYSLLKYTFSTFISLYLLPQF